MNRVFSGVQPTGNLHLGNYLGAIKNWVGYQSEYECLFCVVDLHAITVPQDPKTLRSSILTTAAAYIACGINPEKSLIYPQSSIPQHAELAWILGCLTPRGWLNRMTQFKEKAGKRQDEAVLGLYAYPVLMAADILLFHATHVPVGEDQKQHLELARDIAGAFNRAYATEYFTLPEPMILAEVARIMSLRDGTKKMSKSDESDQSRINLTDSADDIAQKIKRAKSDMEVGISYDPEKRPEASNLLSIYAALSGITIADAATQFSSANFSQFKQALTEVTVEKLTPIRAEMERLLKDQPYLASILTRGTERASVIAEKTTAEVKEYVGLYR